MNLTSVDVVGDLTDILMRLHKSAFTPSLTSLQHDFVGWLTFASRVESLMQSKLDSDADASSDEPNKMLGNSQLDFLFRTHFSGFSLHISGDMMCRLSESVNSYLSTACNSIHGQCEQEIACRNPTRLIHLINGLYDL